VVSVEKIMEQVSHRPFPLPSVPWVMFQQWSDLLFAHWAMDPKEIRPLVPAGLELDVFDKKAWVAITPFRMTDIHPRGLPAIPGTGSFLEMNFRTYVRVPRDGRKRPVQEHGRPGTELDEEVERPGVFFFSLDASNLPAVMAARVGLGLPYFWADMTATPEEGGRTHYMSRRRQNGAKVEVRYGPVGEVRAKSDLEAFLTERYCLYEVRLGVVQRTEIHHVPWALQEAKGEFLQNTVPAAHGIKIERQPDLMHFSRQIDVVVFPPAVAGSGSG
jgi:uncharacterized protein YqjF (DUF2071 family)